MIRRDDPRLDVLAVFGLGHVRPASGTWGSLPPIGLAVVLLACGQTGVGSPWVWNGAMVLVALAFSAACVLWGDQAESIWGKDPSPVVADEVAGQAVALLAFPAAALDWHGAVLLVFAFLAFRLFDIIKPAPANGLQAIPGGWGVLLDDLVAGFYALIAVQVAGFVIAGS